MKLPLRSLACAIYTMSVYCYAEIETLEHKTKQIKEVLTLPAIVITAKQAQEVGRTQFDKTQLEQQPNSNKTITDFLKVHPNVQFSSSSAAGAQQGEIEGAEVSIHGALLYDNKLMLDQVRLNNLINPAGGNNDYHQSAMSGRSIANTANMDLICELEVLDSNVSAEYGEFTGGVIRAKTCAPQSAVGDIHGKISFDYTSSAWTSFSHVSEEELQGYEALKENYQKEFEKQGVSALLYGRLNDKVGLNLGVATRWSDINIPSALNIRNNADQERKNDNINLNIHAILADVHQLKLGLQFQNDQKDLEQVNVLNSQKKVNSENKAIDLNLESKFRSVTFNQSLVYQQQVMNNNSLEHSLVPWRTSTNKNWTIQLSSATEGGYGDLKQQVESLEYSLKSTFEPFQFLDTQHQWVIGMGYGHFVADWERLNRVYSYFLPSAHGIQGTDCLDATGGFDEYCDLSYNNGIGQFHVQRDVLAAGKIAVKQDRAHVFIEDRIQWNKMLKATLGLRADFDRLSKNNNIAPRSTFVYQPFQDSRLSFTTGWNRYYANNAFGYALQDGIQTLNTREKRDSVQDEWTFSSNSNGVNVQRSQLNTPFVDESVFALNGQWKAVDTQLKYVHRGYKEQVRKQRISFSPLIDEYNNDGQSSADSYSISISNIEPMQLWSMQHRLQMSADYIDLSRNFNHYDDDPYNPLTYKKYILYNNQIMDEANRPADQFEKKWTLRLGWNMQFDNLPIQFSHFLRYRSPYEALINTNIPKADQPIGPDGNAISQRYDVKEIGSAFSWDLRASYSLALAYNQQLTLGLTVNNVTNRVNHYKSTAQGSSDLYSEPGRQFIADLSFKF